MIPNSIIYNIIVDRAHVAYPLQTEPTVLLYYNNSSAVIYHTYILYRFNKPDKSRRRYLSIYVRITCVRCIPI